MKLLLVYYYFIHTIILQTIQSFQLKLPQKNNNDSPMRNKENNVNNDVSRIKMLFNTNNTDDSDNNNVEYNNSKKQFILQSLVRVGDEYSQRIRENSDFMEKFDNLKNNVNIHYSENECFKSKIAKVPGCTATVHVRVVVTPEKNIKLEGIADARVSNGLLARVAHFLEGQTVEQVKALVPTQISNTLDLLSVLSRGRNDGVASIVECVQLLVGELKIGDEEYSNEDDCSSLTICNNENTASESSTCAEQMSQKQSSKPKLALLLSGGVDSSTALALLVDTQEYDITCFYLKIWLEDELAHLGECPWEEDYAVCCSVCEKFGVKLETVSLQEQYKQRVISYTIEEASKGRTPNPDIMCNARVKFGCFYDAIEGNDFDYVATGHYVASCQDEASGKTILYRAPDDVKDQSYFLSTLSQNQLSKAIFPLGQYTKAQVRKLAQEFDLPNKTRPDSQGLCFLGKVKFDDFLSAYLGESPGDIVDASSGDVIGHHKGLWFHTVGQRKGLGPVLDVKINSQGPWYVVAKDPEANDLFVSNKYDQEEFDTARSEFYVEDIKWISIEAPYDLLLPQAQVKDKDDSNTGCLFRGDFDMKIRHGPKIVQGRLTIAKGSNTGKINLKQKDGGLAPGQFVVFYTPGDNVCLGAGIISEHHWAKFLNKKETTETI